MLEETEIPRFQDNHEYEGRKITLHYQVNAFRLHGENRPTCTEINCSNPGIQQEVLTLVEVEVDGRKVAIDMAINVLFLLPKELQKSVLEKEVIRVVFCTRCYINGLLADEENDA